MCLLGLYRVYTRAILGLYGDYLRVILGLFCASPVSLVEDQAVKELDVLQPLASTRTASLSGVARTDKEDIVIS